jgi:DNA (cytosine-5)-methyltransferase 1
MSALYNEIEPYAAEWTTNLAQAGHIAAGVVDRRSIVDLRSADIAGAIQFHAFAGIGAWSYALRLAGWPDDQPAWTGSCPCQPFSGAGRKGGFDDERHLWPTWFGLIRECRPPVVFGEQVASPDGLAWLDAVSADLEGEGYAFGAADLCAASVGAPHIRQRLYFVAYRVGDGLQARQPSRSAPRTAVRDGAPGRVVNAAGEQRPRGADLRREERGWPQHPSPWGDVDWLECTDGRRRPVEPGSFPLAHGAPARVGRLRAYGNAIVPQVAATFIASVMDAIDTTKISVLSDGR